MPQQHSDWLARLRKHLADDERLDKTTLDRDVRVARGFLHYLDEREIRLQSVTSAVVQQYLRRQRQAYRSRHGAVPHDDIRWRSQYTAPIHHLLRVAQGTWPPVPGFEQHLNKFGEALRHDGFAANTVRNSVKHARRFLRYLTARKISPEQATPRDVDAFMQSARGVYRRTVNSPRHTELRWQSRYRKAVHRLLECVQGEWPPPSAGKSLLRDFEADLVKRGIKELDVFRRHARLFVEYLEQRDLDAAKVQPSDVEDYFRVALRLSKRHRPNLVLKPQYWFRMGRRTVRAILRFVQGEWPPGSRPSPLVGQFRAYLEQAQYSYGIVPNSVAAVNQFLRYLQSSGKAVEAARPSDVAAFVEQKLEQYKKRHGGPPPTERKWRSGYTGPIHRMLRLVDPQWPRPEPPRNEAERIQRALIDSYGRWLVDDHGLSQATFRKNGDEAKLFLAWMESTRCVSLSELNVPDLDAYLALRLPGLRRSSRHGLCDGLRSFLRFLHSRHLTSRDLSPTVSVSTLYRFEEIPRALSEDQVQAVLRCTRKDRTPIGLRDYAMLLLLATYGLRAGEVTRLQLDDIDWRDERLRIRHSKTGYESLLPLVAPVGEAVLDYLRRGRPQTSLRQVFLQAIAPYQAFKQGASLCTIIRYRLQKAGVKPRGHQGAHAFRFARAHSLLSASVPMKAIGDLFGHRNADSTAVYLKLVTDDLRAIGLDLPSGEKICGIGPTKTKRS